MKYSELGKIAEKHGWEKTDDSEYWMTYTKNDINIEIYKGVIDNGITLWAENNNNEISLNDELDFINACVELGQTSLVDREDMELYYLKHKFINVSEKYHGFLNQKKSTGKYFVSSMCGNDGFKTKFNKYEIENIIEKFGVSLDDWELIEVAEDEI